MRLTRSAVGAATLAVTMLDAAGYATMKSEPMELDTADIAYVEGAAKKYATQVIWVNLPQRPVSAFQPAQPAETLQRPAQQ